MRLTVLDYSKMWLVGLLFSAQFCYAVPSMPLPVPQMVQIPAGDFTIGCQAGRDDHAIDCEPNQLPARKVQVQSFWLGKTEVTVDEYMACVTARACKQPEWAEPNYAANYTENKPVVPHYEQLGEGLKSSIYPIVGVSWDDTQDYLKWLSKVTSQSYRLPTEAEWEYAARAGKNSAYPWGDALGINQANCLNEFCKDSFATTSPVGSFAANAFGLQDMHGNVQEWVADCLSSYNEPNMLQALFSYLPNCQNWNDPDLNGLHVIRGGSWPSIRLLSSSRGGYEATRRMDNLGFRVVRSE